MVADQIDADRRQAPDTEDSCKLPTTPKPIAR